MLSFLDSMATLSFLRGTVAEAYPITQAIEVADASTGLKIFGGILLYLCSSISSAGGVGGGALNVSIFFFLWGFTYKQSVIMSLATLMGNYSCQVAINIPQRHPLVPTRPIIYWEALLILLPAELGGANIGVILSAIFPSTLCIILGTFVIAVALYFTAEKGVQFYKKESLVLLYGAETNVPLLTGADFDYSNPMTDSTKKKKKRGSEASSGSGSTGLDDTFEESNPMFENDDNTSSTSTSTFTSPQKRGSVRMIGSPESQKSKKNIEEYGIYTQNINKNDGNDDDKDKDIEKDGDKNKDTDKEKDNNKKESSNNRYDRSPNPPVISTENRYTEIDEKPFIKQPYAIIVSVLVVWAMYATLYIAQELTSKCSWGYFVLLTIIYPLLFAQVYYGVTYLNQQQKREIPVEGDIIWSDFSSTLPIVALVIGIFTSLLGVGGGELMGPLLLHLKVLPTVAPATTSFMSLLNSSSSLIHYVTLGEVSFLYALIAFLIGAAGGTTGRLLAVLAANNYGRPSVMTFMLCSVLFLSLILYIYSIFTEKVTFAFNAFCSV